MIVESFIIDNRNVKRIVADSENQGFYLEETVGFESVLKIVGPNAPIAVNIPTDIEVKVLQFDLGTAQYTLDTAASGVVSITGDIEGEVALVNGIALFQFEGSEIDQYQITVTYPGTMPTTLGVVVE